MCVFSVLKGTTKKRTKYIAFFPSLLYIYAIDFCV